MLEGSNSDKLVTFRTISGKRLEFHRKWEKKSPRSSIVLVDKVAEGTEDPENTKFILYICRIFNFVIKFWG